MTELDVKDKIAFITIKNPPVNAMSLNVRNSILKNIDEAVFDENVKAIIIKGSGKTFCAGADISEFKTGVVFENFIAFVINDIEDCGKPVFGLIHGNAFGGGLELALGCHFRIASSKSSVGLPEVKIGIMPGAGGTQRLPRLIGFWHSVDLICSGKTIKSAEAYSKGIIDLVVDVPKDVNGDAETAFMEKAAVKFVKEHWDDDLNNVIASKKPFEGLSSFFYSQVEKKIKKSSRGMIAPITAFEVMKKSVGLTFEKGMELEQDGLGLLMRSNQTSALQYLFFSERNSSKIPLILKKKTDPIKSVGIIGAGMMGSGIAICVIKAKIPVVLVEQNDSNLKRVVTYIKKNFSDAVKKGRITDDMKAGFLQLLTPTTDFKHLGKVDLVIEAVFEDMRVKKYVMKKLDSVCKQSAIITSNTSTLDIDEIASATSRTENVMGMHFFAPANIMKLIENVRGKATSSETIHKVMALSKRLKKTPVLVGNCFGFVANRMLIAYTIESLLMSLKGATPSEIDKVMYDYGFPMGPFQVCDLSGLDIVNHIRNSSGAAYDKKSKGSDSGKFSKTPVYELIDYLVSKKHLGFKTQRGIYLYKKGSRKPLENPDVTNKLEEIRKKMNIQDSNTNPFNEKQIVDRNLIAIINEGFKCLEDGTALRPSDIDIVWVFGFGFPPYKGGPMYQAEQIGLPEVLKRLKAYREKEETNIHWYPSKLLEKLVKSGTSLTSHYKAKSAKSKL